MNEPPSTERLFSLSCFEGLRLFRIYKQKNADLDDIKVLDIVLNVEADAASLDMQAAFFLHQNVSASCPLDGEVFYQNCIKSVVVDHQPIWSKSMRQGRIRFVDSLSDDDRDVFMAAGLLGNPPNIDVVAWWDEIVGYSRQKTDIEKMLQARRAEALTIELERERLRKIGIDRAPEWVGLDDNFAGYDVLSYDLNGNSVVKRMIEVKSTIASPLRFYLSRNEWDTADSIGNAYKFHIWNMATHEPFLYEKSVEDVRPHIPEDNQKGKWKNTEIPVNI